MRAADVDDDAVVIERLGDEGRVDHERRAVQRLRGPNTAPRNEWAIMMWSRTSTANTGGLLKDKRSVGKACRSLASESLAAAAGRSSKRDRRRQQHIEHVDRSSKASAAASRRPWLQRGRCDGAILPTWLDISRSRRL